ncbi:hypothetical protein [Ruegeria faecimaris]|uniref:Type IV pilus biogenesis protein PilP n=1 Tax=Ruegeria faecimaris TaxID=686389 RepID=A0A521BK81_9RHOB|nr:hypothetical protein [Ruegeria faecimaris]SMO47482.1 hypothetical protein SAMN06265380_101897 [Ruegeria faecimaris]
MKPAFALSISTTGISLHHNSDGDWFAIGEVSLDASYLEEQLKVLRDKGFALENDLSCKVVIPRDQVKFIKVDTAGSSFEETEQAVQNAVSDATPYDLTELVYVTADDGATTCVAVVPRDTLEEARGFVLGYGFVPVAFSAAYETDDFPTEPFFPLGDAPATTNAPKVIATDPAQDSPVVHAIADSTAPTSFWPVQKVAAPTWTSLPSVRIAAAVALMLVAGGIWSLFREDSPAPADSELALLDETISQPEPSSGPVEPAETPAAQAEVTVPEAAEPEMAPTSESEPELSATDQAILEALNVAPTLVDEIELEPEPQLVPTQPEIEITSPGLLIAPAQDPQIELYLASKDDSNLSRDAIALPPVHTYDTDLPFDFEPLSTAAGARFSLDERGLVIPTKEGVLNPDGVVVYLGTPSKTPPPSALVRLEKAPVEEVVDNRLATLRPKPRPENLTENFERQRLQGRTLKELSGIRPKPRPESLLRAPPPPESTEPLAEMRVPRPKLRPAGLTRQASAGTATLGSAAGIEQLNNEVGTFQPKTTAPKIPSSASVARQATIDNAINLRKLNLIGVYGSPSNRRALVRLPSGRYKKLKIGDRLDGGNVIAISDNELRYQKRGRNVVLKMPRG